MKQPVLFTTKELITESVDYQKQLHHFLWEEQNLAEIEVYIDGLYGQKFGDMQSKEVHKLFYDCAVREVLNLKPMPSFLDTITSDMIMARWILPFPINLSKLPKDDEAKIVNNFLHFINEKGMFMVEDVSFIQITDPNCHKEDLFLNSVYLPNQFNEMLGIEVEVKVTEKKTG